MNFAAPSPELQPLPGADTPAYLCPPDLLLRARRLGTLPVAVAGAGAAHVLQSLAWAVGFGLVAPILVGDPKAIAANLPGELAGARVIAAGDEADAAAKAVALVKSGEASLLMKGHVHTDTLLRAALAPGIGLRTGSRLSHVFAMYWAGRSKPLLITDAALNVAPDARTFAAIIRHALLTARALGISHPRIAMLSATEEASQAVPSSLAAAEFASTFRDEALAQGAYISGPMALDVAVSATAAEIKGLKADPVAGHADILAVPNIETGNALFKMLVHVVNATAAGIVLGAAAPIVLTSRADPAEARLASVALARLVAAEHG
ncbi:MAG: phosphate acetyltransferase [Rhodospirillales bacterium]|nr:phosphate acetyltransferase [Rhodospirillales bacterium]